VCFSCPFLKTAEDLMNMTWLARRTHTVSRLKSVTFSTRAPNPKHIFDGREFTVVVNWGVIAEEMSNIVKLIIPNELADIVVLYASPLNAFVQEDVPQNTNNNKNNKWFLGESSCIEYRNYGPFPSTKQGIASKLLHIINDENLSQSLFDLILNRNQLLECIPTSQMSYCVRELNLPKKRLLGLFRSLIRHAAVHKDLDTQHWFHENCPLDNF
jgi:hypothetical protein